MTIRERHDFMDVTRYFDLPQRFAIGIEFLHQMLALAANEVVAVPSLADAAEIQLRMFSVINDEGEPVAQKNNAAAQLLIGQQFEAAIEAFTRIAKDHPEERADCENAIGAAHFFLEHYETAIAHYKLAGELGADPGTVRDNIEEAEEEIAKRDAAAGSTEMGN